MKPLSLRMSALALFAALGCAGCMTATTPLHDAQFGAAVRAAARAQTLVPHAGAHGDPVAGLDGAAGRAAIERYQASFREPPASFEVLNIGGSATGASAR